jgi:hypothetical protein
MEVSQERNYQKRVVFQRSRAHSNLILSTPDVLRNSK